MFKLTTKEILDENLARKAPQELASVKIIVHDIRSLHNVGAIFRSADAFGISEVILSGHSPTPPRSEINKTAIGAEEFVEWQYEKSGLDAIRKLKQKSYHIIGLEQTTESIPLPEFELDGLQKICIVLGSEVSGIDDDLLSEIDQFVSIPQFGYKHSLNVSVAAGVALYAILEKAW